MDGRGGGVLVARIKSVHMDQMTTCICILINNNSKHIYDSVSDLNGFYIQLSTYDDGLRICSIFSHCILPD